MSPSAHTVDLENRLQTIGSMRMLASDTTSRLFAIAVSDGRWSTYSKKYGAEDMRAMNAIQKNRLLRKIISHGTLRSNACRLWRKELCCPPHGVISRRFRKATRYRITVPTAYIGMTSRNPRR